MLGCDKWQTVSFAIMLVLVSALNCIGIPVLYKSIVLIIIVLPDVGLSYILPLSYSRDHIYVTL